MSKLVAIAFFALCFALLAFGVSVVAQFAGSFLGFALGGN